MAKLRHLAIVVKDMEASAQFYEKIFDMKRAYEVKDRAIYLTDGVMNLAVIAALTLLVGFEKLAPFGVRTAWASGALLIAAGAWMLLGSTL